MTEDEPNDDTAQAALEAVQRWRRSVVRLWIATMLAALGVWGLLAATTVPWVIEAGSAALLLLLIGLATWNMCRGTCPRCRAVIRFRPRIELPPACPYCGARLAAGRREAP